MDEFIKILLGALMGFVLPYCVKIVVYLFKRFVKSAICGEWKSYLWWTNNGKIELCKMDVIIKRGILHSYKVIFIDSTSIYKGTANIEDNNLCINMKSSDTILNASTQHRFELPTEENRDRIFGFWLSFDGDKRVSCGGSILSKNKLSKKQVSDIVQKEYSIPGNVPLMVLKN